MFLYYTFTTLNWKIYHSSSQEPSSHRTWDQPPPMGTPDSMTDPSTNRYYFLLHYKTSTIYCATPIAVCVKSSRLTVHGRECLLVVYLIASRHVVTTRRRLGSTTINALNLGPLPGRSEAYQPSGTQGRVTIEFAF